MPEWKVLGYFELKRLGSSGFGDLVLARNDITRFRQAPWLRSALSRWTARPLASHAGDV